MTALERRTRELYLKPPRLRPLLLRGDYFPKRARMNGSVRSGLLVVTGATYGMMLVEVVLIVEAGAEVDAIF